MDIAEWFDIKYIKHLEAYRHLQNTGMWPEGFIPKGVVLKPTWQTDLMAAFTNAYIHEKIWESENIVYSNSDYKDE